MRFSKKKNGGGLLAAALFVVLFALASCAGDDGGSSSKSSNNSDGTADTPLRVASSDRNGISLAWDHVVGARRYVIFRATGTDPVPDVTADANSATDFTSDANYNFHLDVTDDASPNFTYRDTTGLDYSTEYRYKLLVCKPDGCSPLSAATTANTVSSVFAATNFNSLVSDSDSILLTWPAVAGATRYAIFRDATSAADPHVGIGLDASSDFSGFSNFLVAKNAADTSHDDASGITAGTSAFKYWIMPCRADGCAPLSNGATGLAAPSVPTGLALLQPLEESISDTSGDRLRRVDLSWNAATGATFYQVRRTVSGGGTGIVASPISATYSDADVTYDASHDYQVSACRTTTSFCSVPTASSRVRPVASASRLSESSNTFSGGATGVSAFVDLAIDATDDATPDTKRYTFANFTISVDGTAILTAYSAADLSMDAHARAIVSSLNGGDVSVDGSTYTASINADNTNDLALKITRDVSGDFTKTVTVANAPDAGVLTPATPQFSGGSANAAATSTLTVNSPVAADARDISIKVDGVFITLSQGDSSNDVAGKIVAGIQADAGYGAKNYSVANADNVVTFTKKAAGTGGNGGTVTVQNGTYD